MLFNLIDLRHQRGSTAITSNIKLSAWGKHLGDATVTAAILDRLAMTAIRLDIDGPSYCQHLAHQRADPVESDAGVIPAAAPVAPADLASPGLSRRSKTSGAGSQVGPPNHSRWVNF